MGGRPGALDDGPWIPGSVAVPGAAEEVADLGVPPDRDGMHSGVGGLALVLAEIRLVRPWTAEETSLAAAVADRVRATIPTESGATFFDGLASTVGVLIALDADGAAEAVDRLTALATPDGWPQSMFGPPRYLPGTRLHDATLGTAGVLLAALWARRCRVDGADALARRAAEVLMAEAEPQPTGTTWRFLPLRYRTDPPTEMPNFSHGLAGIAAALALAGSELDRPDLTTAAASGAEHLVTLGSTADGGLLVPRCIPDVAGLETYTHTWCHGGTGTSLLFLALDHAGVEQVAGRTPLSWHRRCLHGVRTSGLPARLRPGFWDNDGRCCGTAGVGDVFLDAWLRSGDDDDLAFALRLADVLVERAQRRGPHAYWRFVEHRAAEPELPPGVGWMQGAAGIAAYLFRVSRVLRDGGAAVPAARMDTWWTVPQAPAVPGPRSAQG